MPFFIVKVFCCKVGIVLKIYQLRESHWTCIFCLHQLIAGISHAQVFDKTISSGTCKNILNALSATYLWMALWWKPTVIKRVFLIGYYPCKPHCAERQLLWWLCFYGHQRYTGFYGCKLQIRCRNRLRHPLYNKC